MIRFWGDDIKKNLDECIQVIEETIFDKMLNEKDYKMYGPTIE